MTTHSTVIFTACSVNYLGKAIALGLSALEHHDDVDFVILVADGKRPVEITDPRIRLLWAEDLDYPDYLRCAFKYNIIEFNTALKPYASLHLLRSYEQVVYLDPDVCVYGPLESVFAALSQHAAVFTPHSLSPYQGEGRPNDRDLLRFGSCNLGFFAVNRRPAAQAMLQWWHERCQTECFYEPQAGFGVDQKWIDLAFSFFDGMYLLRDPGLNVAFWNLHERTLSLADGVWRVNASHRLGFIHFSSFDEADVRAVAGKQTRYESGSRPDFSQASTVYRNYLEQAKDMVRVDDARYRYGQFDNGDPLSASLRRLYAVSERDDVRAAADPFAAGGVVHAFAQAHGLISRRAATTVHTNFKAQSAYATQQRIISRAFRLVLRVLGPDRYFDLMRYLGHYSSLLNQGDLLRK